MATRIEREPSFYKFDSESYLNTFAVTPELFEEALKNNLQGPNSGRNIHDELFFGNEDGTYPEYIKFPVVYRYLGGNMMRDMIDTHKLHSFLISDRMKSVMEENGITGWKSFPVLVYDKEGNEIKGYNGFTVTGRGGRKKYLIPFNEIPYGEDAEYIQWDKSQWDGSDIFTIGFGLIATERVRLLFKQNKITSPRFTPLSERVTIL